MKKVRWWRLGILVGVIVIVSVGVGVLSFTGGRELISALFSFPVAERRLQERDAVASTVDSELKAFRSQREAINAIVVSKQTLPKLLTDIDALLLANTQLVTRLEELVILDTQLLDITAGGTKEVVLALQSIDRSTLQTQHTWEEVYERKHSVFAMHQEYITAISCQNAVNYKTSNSRVVSQLKKCADLSATAVSKYKAITVRYTLISPELEAYNEVWLKSQDVLRQSYEQASKNAKKAVTLSKQAQTLRKQAAAIEIAAVISGFEQQLIATHTAEISRLEEAIESERQNLSEINTKQWFSL